MFKIENGILSKEGYEATISYQKYIEIASFLEDLMDDKGVFNIDEAIKNSPFPVGEFYLALDLWDSQNLLNKIQLN